MSRVYTYTRSATGAPAAQQAHDAALRAWLARHPGYTLAGAFEDLGVSGLTSPAARAGFQALLAALQAAPADLVLVPSLDRVSRDLGVLCEVREQLWGQGVRLLTVESAPEAAEAETRLFREVVAAVGETRLRRGAGGARA